MLTSDGYCSAYGWEAGGGVRILLECFLVSGWGLCSSGGYASYWNVFLFQGGVCVQAGGTRPTGMLSCLRVVFVFKQGVRVLLECFLVSGWCLCSSRGYASYWNAFLFQGGVCVQAGGTCPTGMLSFFRVVFVFGKRLSDTIEDITPTYLTPRVLATLREADTIANKVLRDSGTHFILLIAHIIHSLKHFF